MSGNAWSEKLGRADAAPEDEPEGYQAWRQGKTGLVRDLKFVPAVGSGERLRVVPLLQPISMELDDDATQLAVMCNITGQLIFIEGQGLDALLDMISHKKVESIHVWSDKDGPKPAEVVTAVRFDKSLHDLAVPE